MANEPLERGNGPLWYHYGEGMDHYITTLCNTVTKRMRISTNNILYIRERGSRHPSADHHHYYTLNKGPKEGPNIGDVMGPFMEPI